jgi:DNA replication protein DnaC
MLDDLHRLLDTLRLCHMREHVAQALQDAQKRKPSYGAFLVDLLSHELHDKRNRTIANRLRRSGLREYWTLETFPWALQPCLSKHKRALETLAELEFLDRGESVVFTGQAGVGKSGLASGLLLKALFAGRTGHAITAQDLFDELAASLADRSTKALLRRLSRVDVLLVDEFGYVNAPSPIQINNFFRLMDSRCNRKSTIVTTNLGFQEWGKFLGNGPLTAALLSRLLQKCSVFPFPSSAVNLREPKLKLPTSASLPEVLTPS